MKSYLYFFLITFYFQNFMSSTSFERRAATIEKSEKSLSGHTIKDVQELSDLLGLRNQKNIIILSDIYESYKNFKFIDKTDIFEPPVVTIDLVKAMLENQTILCTRSLMLNFYYLINVWVAFLRSTPQELQKKYGFLKDMALSKIENIQKSIQQVQALSEEFNRSDDWDVQDNIIHDMLKIVKDSDVHERLFFYLFIIKEYYEEIIKKLPDYDFYQVNPLFVLLYPKKVSSIDVSLLQKMDLDSFSNFVFHHDDRNNAYIDQFCIDAIKKVIKKETDKSLEIATPDQGFFKWNIFMLGHGEPDTIIGGVKDITFAQILKYFNQNQLADTVSVLSCFSGGKTFKKLFEHEFLSQADPLVQKINFPILFFGVFFSETAMYPLILWKHYKQNLLEKDYSNFFKDLESRDFFVALNFWAIDYNERGIFHNYGAIKFPHVSWITVSDYQKNVFNITKVSIVTTYPKYTMEIPDSKNIVLMSTNIIPLHIAINMADRKESNRCKFLPVFYMDPNYAINLIDISGMVINPVNREEQIAEILYGLFDMKLTYLSEPISIFIKKVFIGRYQIKNVLIELDKNQIFFESLNKPGMIVKGEYKNKILSIEKIEPDQDYMQKINTMEKRLSNVTAEGFLSDVTPQFIKKLKNIYKPKLNPQAKPFIPQSQRLSPEDQFFRSKIQPIQR